MTASVHNDPPQRMVKASDDQKRQTATGRRRATSLGTSTVGWMKGETEREENKDGALVTMRCWSPARVALLLVSMRPRCGRLRRGESVAFGLRGRLSRVTGRVGKLMRGGFQCCADTGGACLKKRAGGEQQSRRRRLQWSQHGE